MSKARKRFTDTPGKPQWIFPDYPEPPARSADDVDADVMRAASGTVHTLPREIMDAVTATARGVVHYIGPTAWDTFKGYGLRKQLSGEVKDENEFITDLVMQAAEEGFRLALARYSLQLKHVPELAGWRRKRKQGGDTGRAKQTAAKLNRAAQAQALLSEGHDVPEIAKRLGRSISTVYRDLGAEPAPRAKVTRPRRKR